MIIRKAFYKEKNKWYIDLPEFLEQGLGTKDNLLMVAGADTFLDLLSNNSGKITVQFSSTEFQDYLCKLIKKGIGMDKEFLDEIGHAQVDYGAYYDVVEMNKKPFLHNLWLCPVTEYVFGGSYPDEIYIQI